MAKNRYDIAVIPGDGIGKEVVPEGLRALEAAAQRFDIPLHFDHFDFASYDYYAQHGDMMPEDWKGWPLRKDYVQPDFYEMQDAY